MLLIQAYPFQLVHQQDVRHEHGPGAECDPHPVFQIRSEPSHTMLMSAFVEALPFGKQEGEQGLLSRRNIGTCNRSILVMLD
jgi:hypothetical protein